jgi:competence ComEA-like helix-hairpin-helix protein
LDIRPAAVAWFLGVTLLIGASVRGYRAWVGPEELPLQIVREPESAVAQLVDSIATARQQRVHRPIALNSSTAAEFERLPGIGPVLARNIVEDRARNGRFRTLDDLTRVSGIGPKRLAAIRDQCVLDSMDSVHSGAR